MHSERSDSPCPALGTEIERIVMMVLLLGSGHGPWSLAGLQREISGATGDPIDITDAIDELYGAGLVHVSGGLVTCDSFVHSWRTSLSSQPQLVHQARGARGCRVVGVPAMSLSQLALERPSSRSAQFADNPEILIVGLLTKS